MEENKFTVTEKEINEVHNILKRLDNIAVTPKMLKFIYSKSLVLQSFFDTFLTHFLSPLSNLLTEDQKRQFFAAYHKRLTELFEQECNEHLSAAKHGSKQPL